MKKLILLTHKLWSYKEIEKELVFYHINNCPNPQIVISVSINENLDFQVFCISFEKIYKIPNLDNLLVKTKNLYLELNQPTLKTNVTFVLNFVINILLNIEDERFKYLNVFE